MKILKAILNVKIINYFSIQLTYINLSSPKKALNNLSNCASILVTAAMGEIDESKAGARLGWLSVTWSHFSRMVYCQMFTGLFILLHLSLFAIVTLLSYGSNKLL